MSTIDRVEVFHKGTTKGEAYGQNLGKPVTKEEVISYIESMGTKIIIPKVDDFTKKPPAEQWMIEAIRSVGFE